MLVVEDNWEIADFVRRVAESEGYTVRTATIAAAFEAALARDDAEVIILDLALPYADGLATINQLAATGARGKILLMSGLSEAMRRMAHLVCEQQGLDMAGIIPKPVRAADIRKILNELP